MKRKKLPTFPKNVFILSLVSLLNDIAGETIKKLFPLFLSNVLGVKMTIIGVVEGVGEATPHIFEPLSGYLSDRFGKRKIFVVFGQILRSSMVLLFFVVSWPQALLVRFLDRTGKGIALSPRDALISSSTKDGQQGRSFGLNRAMDNLGATLGIGILLLIFYFYGGPKILDTGLFKVIVLIVAVPSLLVAFILIVLGVNEKKNNKEKYNFKDHLGKEFYTFLAISFLFSLGNFSDGFLVLKAQSVGVSLFGIFALLGAYTLSSSIIALPVGSYSDHHERRRVLAFGWLVFSASYIGFGVSESIWQLFFLFIIYGMYYGATQGVAKAIVADLVPHSKQGVAFGLYNMTIGLALLPASIVAGYLWQRFTPIVPFYFGALMALIGAYGLFHILPHPEKAHS